jgi:Ca2+:H+ antiporter
MKACFIPQITLFFTPFEVATLAVSVLLVTIISLDGESNWLEGTQLLAVYVIVALGFFYVL